MATFPYDSISTAYEEDWPARIVSTNDNPMPSVEIIDEDVAELLEMPRGTGLDGDLVLRKLKSVIRSSNSTSQPSRKLSFLLTDVARACSKGLELGQEARHSRLISPGGKWSTFHLRLRLSLILFDQATFIIDDQRFQNPLLVADLEGDEVHLQLAHPSGNTQISYYIPIPEFLEHVRKQVRIELEERYCHDGGLCSSMRKIYRSTGIVAASWDARK